MITIVPLGVTLPNTEDICGWEVAWIYTEGKIYICDGENLEFAKHHEIAHFLWENVLTTKDKENYLKLYQEAKKRGISAFWSDYEMSDWEEDFCTNYSLVTNKIKSKLSLKKRQKFILNILNSH